MKLERLYHSLRFKVTVGVLLPLLIILLGFSYLRHANYQSLLMNNLQVSAAGAGQIIEGSLQPAMLDNDFSELQQIIENIHTRPEVRDLFLLSKSGHVLISTEAGVTGTEIDLSDATCQTCHRFDAASRNENVILDLEDGERVFRNVNAIENKPECHICHDPDAAILGVLISDFDLTAVEDALAADRRRSALWSAGAILLTVVVVDLLMSKMVIGRLKHLARAIKRVSTGDLDVQVMDRDPDEIGELTQAFNHMTDGLKEKEALEQSLQEQTTQLQAQAERLATLNTIAGTVSQSLDLEQILNSALDKVLELIKLKAGWVVLQSPQGFDLAAIHGLPEQVALAHVHCEWNRGMCSDVLELGQARLFRNLPQHPCPTAEYFAERGLIFRACVPLTSKNRILGVMSLVGHVSDSARTLTEDTLEMLTAIGRQIGIAVENASLYEDLRQQETLRRRLLERVITVQEEERKRIALELHDETGQPLTSLIMTLSVLADAHCSPEIQPYVQDARDTAGQVLKQVHDLALELRPSVLDDLGLLPALRHLTKGYQDRFHVPVDFEAVNMDGERLPSEVETALYRIVQEALTNVARYAQADSVSVLLKNRSNSVVLIVEDDGLGFDVAQFMSSGLRDKKLGLYGMRERASLLGGTLTIESTPGTGTAVFVEIPLGGEEGDLGQDPSIGG
jgi:signal transduction histidine kinase